MTSNLAQQEIAAEAEFLRKETVAADALKNGVKEEPRTLTRKFIDHTIYPILRGHFQRDEFLGRINEILFFLPFSEGELKQLVEKQLQSWQKRAEERHSIKLEWDDSVIRALTSEYNLSYGARSIKHGVERKAINQIARAHEMDEIGAGSTVKLFVDNGGEIRIKTTKPASGGGIGFLSGLFGGNGGKTNGGDEKGKADEGGKGGSQGKGPRIIEIK